MPDVRLPSKYLRPFVIVLCYAQGLAHGDSSLSRLVSHRSRYGCLGLPAMASTSTYHSGSTSAATYTAVEAGRC